MTRTLRVGDNKYSLELATTPGQQEKGLSGRASMPQDHGMLFIFGGASDQCFWMKGMHFPLDIIWTDALHKVVYMQPDLSPSTYPHTYCSTSAANYVIELNAGAVKRSGIHMGQVRNF